MLPGYAQDTFLTVRTTSVLEWQTMSQAREYICMEFPGKND